MPYVGNPLADAFSSREKQDLTGQSGTSFTLTHAVSHANDLSVYINHVRQEPTTAYSVNGTTLTTTGSVAATDDFYIIYDELAVQSISHPTDQALTATSGTFTSGLVGTTGTFSGALSATTGTFSGALDIQGQELILDADNDTSITADTDDQIDIKVGGTDTVVITADAMELKGPHPSFSLTDSDDNNYGGLFYNNGSITLAADHGATGATGAISFQIDSSEKARISSDGRVGIGAAGEATVKLEVNAAGLATTISGRSDGGNGNNRRFNINAVASGNGTYGGGLKIETRNDSNVFSEIFEYNAYQQEIFKGNYRTADAQSYSDKKHLYASSENFDFTTTTNGAAQTLTMTNTLPYQMGTPFFVRVYYNSDSSLMTTVYGIFDIGYYNHKVQTLMTHNGTGIINSVTVGSTGAYNSAKLTVTLTPYSNYNANNFKGTMYYGYGVN